MCRSVCDLQVQGSNHEEEHHTHLEKLFFILLLELFRIFFLFGLSYCFTKIRNKKSRMQTELEDISENCINGFKKRGNRIKCTL